MRLNQKLALMAALIISGAACHKDTPIKTTFTPTPTPVVVPEPPRVAPTPMSTGAQVPDLSDYEKVRQMDITEIDKMGLLSDVYFDYDQSDLRENDRATLVRDGESLKKYDFLVVTIEGHADERGTVEYNLALSDKRARVAYDYLVSVGVSPSRIKAVAYGKEIPVCTESNEDCWQRNRRAHFTVTGKTAR
ncbi:MAG: OmpA family protein [Vicinamibacteria bacterium]